MYCPYKKCLTYNFPSCFPPESIWDRVFVLNEISEIFRVKTFRIVYKKRAVKFFNYWYNNGNLTDKCGGSFCGVKNMVLWSVVNLDIIYLFGENMVIWSGVNLDIIYLLLGENMVLWSGDNLNNIYLYWKTSVVEMWWFEVVPVWIWDINGLCRIKADHRWSASVKILKKKPSWNVIKL